MENNVYRSLLHYYPFASYLPYLTVYSPPLQSIPDCLDPLKLEKSELKDNQISISCPTTLTNQSHLPTTSFEVSSNKKPNQRLCGRREIISQKEYKPNQKRQRRKPVELRDNRNVMPTKLKQMFSYLGRSAKSEEVVVKYFDRYAKSGQFTAKRYYSYIKLKRESVANYVTLQMLQSFLKIEKSDIFAFSEEEQHFYIKLVRILFAHFLKNVAALCSLSSNRIKKQQKTEHLRTQRLLLFILTHDGSKSVE